MIAAIHLLLYMSSRYHRDFTYHGAHNLVTKICPSIQSTLNTDTLCWYATTTLDSDKTKTTIGIPEHRMKYLVYSFFVKRFSTWLKNLWAFWGTSIHCFSRRCPAIGAYYLLQMLKVRIYVKIHIHFEKWKIIFRETLPIFQDMSTSYVNKYFQQVQGLLRSQKTALCNSPTK